MEFDQEREEEAGENKGKQKRLSVASARRMIGMVANNYSDAEITEVLAHLYDLAEFSYEFHTAKLSDEPEIDE
ncbi:MAG: hypothetical protein AAFQ15_04950 [Pseudomonadota bacterium]